MYSIYCFTGQRAVYGKYIYNSINTLYSTALITCSNLHAFLHNLFPFVVRCSLKLLVRFKYEVVEGRGLLPRRSVGFIRCTFYQQICRYTCSHRLLNAGWGGVGCNKDWRSLDNLSEFDLQTYYQSKTVNLI